jgi:hypothetical protein
MLSMFMVVMIIKPTENTKRCEETILQQLSILFTVSYVSFCGLTFISSVSYSLFVNHSSAYSTARCLPQNDVSGHGSLQYWGRANILASSGFSLYDLII